MGVIVDTAVLLLMLTLLWMLLLLLLAIVVLTILTATAFDTEQPGLAQFLLFAGTVPPGQNSYKNRQGDMLLLCLSKLLTTQATEVTF